ncbi:MAG: glycogen/starch synthase [Planctomycetota bacterium]
MNIVMVSSEATPFARTGDLGDSVTKLAEELVAKGQTVTLIVPFYPQALAKATKPLPPSEPLPIELKIKIGSRVVSGTVRRTRIAGGKVPVLMIEQPAYFDRPQLYNDGQRDYRDNCERFVFFSRAAVEVVRQLKINPDIIHCHDWQTGLIPALLKIEHRNLAPLNETASVMTVHNIVYQGQFWHWDMELTGLDWKYFNWRQMEFFGQLNLLKTGIVFADAITVNSPEYARAIQTPEHGCGLHGVLRTRYEHLIGISGGVDHYLEIYRHAMRREDASQFVIPNIASNTK